MSTADMRTGITLVAKNAEGEFLLILNPDTVVTESSVKKLLETARSNPEYSVISCRQVNEDGKRSDCYRSLSEIPEYHRISEISSATDQQKK